MPLVGESMCSGGNVDVRILGPEPAPSPHQALFTLRPAHLPPPLNGEFRRHVPLALLLGSCEAAREPKKQPLLAGCELTLR